MEKISQKEIIDNGWWKVFQTYWIDKKGNKGDVITMKRSGGASGASVFILPITKQQEIVYIKEFRYSTEGYELLFPAGAIDEDNFEDAARKELREETGYTAEKYVYLGEFLTGGYIHGASRLYLALGCKKLNEQMTHGLEEIEVFTASPKEINDLINNNIMKCPWSVLAYRIAKDKTSNFTELDI